MSAFSRLLLLSSLGFAAYPATALDEARALHARGDYSAVVEKLNGAQDAPSLILLGESFSQLKKYKEATDVLERAIAIDPANSDAHLWLGRAYGQRAEGAFPTSAIKLAGKSREHLEEAVALNDKNWDALDDLFQYYLQAPGFLGGGVEKAAKLIDKIAQHSPAEAAADRARVAEQRKDYATAESEFREAVQLDPHRSERTRELERFLAKRKASGS